MKAPFTGLRKRAEGSVQPFFALIVGLLLIPAAGAVTSQSFKVSATIVPGCAVATGSGGLLGTLDFGTHNGVESAPVSTSSLAANSEIGVNQAIPVTYTNSNNIALPLFGVALLTGFSPAGTYTDQLTVTLSW